MPRRTECRGTHYARDKQSAGAAKAGRENVMPIRKAWYLENSPEVGQAYADFSKACNEKTVLDAKTRELLMTALACAFRCPHCTETHIARALEAGATKREVTEALLIAAMEAAGTQLAWVREVYEKRLGHEED